MTKRRFLMTILLLLGIAGVQAQQYYIEGFYKRLKDKDDKIKYTLTDIHTKGITIVGKTNLPDTIIYGEMMKTQCHGLPANLVKFPFEKANTEDIPVDSLEFEFEYWDYDNDKWKPDIENCQKNATESSTNDIVLMLVLDYSSSMGGNISRLQNNAISVINSICKAAGGGNAHVGVIAFSGMYENTHVKDISPLTSSNKGEFEDFIKNAGKGTETALYHSMDTAIIMIEDYVKAKQFTEAKFNGSYMITFTDGLDNASVNDNIAISMSRGKRNQYLAHLSKLLGAESDKTILNKPIENFAIGFSGSEKFTGDDLKLFKEVLQRTTIDDEHFLLSNDFDRVEKFFKDIVRKLTNRWRNLNMYVGEAQDGKIRWVLKTKKSSTWFGISPEVGFGDKESTFFGGNFDITFPLNERISLGGRIGVFLCQFTDYETYSKINDQNQKVTYEDKFKTGKIAFLVGPDLKITNYNNSAFLLSAGGGMMADEFAIFGRLGYKFKNPLFITAEALFGGYSGFGFGLGWSFGGRK